MNARNIMQTNFQTLAPSDTIAEAVNKFHLAAASEKKKVFGLMVTDRSDHLVGMLSMYDILLFIQPKHIQIWGEMDDLDPSELYEERLQQVKSILVGDIMTAEVVTISPDTHLMAIADIMIKKHIRRLPVVDGREVIGIVYVSDVFHHLLEKFIPSGTVSSP
jgi:CBS domain-containing protein